MKSVKSADLLYEVERRAEYATRPGFRIRELQLSSEQAVPWHLHTAIADTFYVLEGQIRLSLREPIEAVLLAPGQTFTVPAGRPHHVTNSGGSSATFLILQGLGEYDFVPLD
ncbi:MAG: cupin domain-containing protein [Blastocatellia bacterium]|nr:cupin domain-containing protein [Blastocatellia bacterium]